MSVRRHSGVYGFLLNDEEMKEVTSAGQGAKNGIAVGGFVDLNEQRAVFLLASRRKVDIPLWYFTPEPNMSDPDFTAFSMADCGRTVCFGNYKATLGSVIHRFDADAYQ